MPRHVVWPRVRGHDTAVWCADAQLEGLARHGVRRGHPARQQGLVGAGLAVEHNEAPGQNKSSSGSDLFSRPKEKSRKTLDIGCSGYYPTAPGSGDEHAVLSQLRVSEMTGGVLSQSFGAQQCTKSCPSSGPAAASHLGAWRSTERAAAIAPALTYRLHSALTMSYS